MKVRIVIGLIISLCIAFTPSANAAKYYLPPNGFGVNETVEKWFTEVEGEITTVKSEAKTGPEGKEGKEGKAGPEGKEGKTGLEGKESEATKTKITSLETKVTKLEKENKEMSEALITIKGLLKI